MCDNAVEDDKLRLCCAVPCMNCSVYGDCCTCIGVSGKLGICCCNTECCCKVGAPCLCPFGCMGWKCKDNECAIVSGQCQAFSVVCSCAIPCNEEVPCAITIAGCTIFPKCGYCLKVDYIKRNHMER